LNEPQPPSDHTAVSLLQQIALVPICIALMHVGRSVLAVTCGQQPAAADQEATERSARGMGNETHSWFQHRDAAHAMRRACAVTY
jgi:hypothetical protein